jgi:hypothetical protein
MMNFNLIDLIITVRSKSASRLCSSLYVSGVRFSDACRLQCCHRPDNKCGICSAKDTCAWKIVFGQNLTPDLLALKRYQKPSLPFAFTFPALSDLDVHTTEINCGLVVMGQAIPFLEMLLSGFRELLLPLESDILQVSSRDVQGNKYPLRERSDARYCENLVVLSGSHLLEDQVWVEPCLQIRLLSPLRLIDDGHLLDVFDFSRFAGSLLRRVSSLAYYYGGCEFTCDYKGLSHQAESVVCTDNHFVSSAAKNRKLSGLTGYGSFKGDFRGLFPFLNAGRYVHVGKGAAYGLGVFELGACSSAV